MNKESKIFVAGHNGLVGSAVCRSLARHGYSNLVTRTSAELDLRNREAVDSFFLNEQPEYVFLAAAKVGGIYANNSYPADFIFDNIKIQTSVLEASAKHNVKRLLFFGSSCVYPRDCPQPIKEEYLLSGPLESTNRPYALAKICGIEMCWAMNRQGGTKYLAVMPTNLYGPNDNYDPQNSHVLPALIRKAHEAKTSGDDSVVVWGTGSPLRELMFSDDLADACVFVMGQQPEVFDALVAPEACPLLNIGVGQELTIKEIAELVCKVVGFTGDLVFDSKMPDGTPRKLLDISRLEQLGFKPKVNLLSGIEISYNDYLKRIVNARSSKVSTIPTGGW